jgi:hypothetical protein
MSKKVQVVMREWHIVDMSEIIKMMISATRMLASKDYGPRHRKFNEDSNYNEIPIDIYTNAMVDSGAIVSVSQANCNGNQIRFRKKIVQICGVTYSIDLILALDLILSQTLPIT